MHINLSNAGPSVISIPSMIGILCRTAAGSSAFSVRQCTAIVCLAAAIAAGASGRADVQPLHLSVDNGLSQNSVYCMLQDSRGYLWFGTADGLNRYDGYECRIFRHSASDTASIVDNGIRALADDGRGGLYVGTDKGVDRFDPESGCFIHLTNSWVENLFRLSDGSLWITCGWRITVYDPSTGTVTPFMPAYYDGRKSDVVRAVVEAGDSCLWIGCEYGLERYDRRSRRIASYNGVLRAAGWTGAISVRSIWRDGGGLWWIHNWMSGLHRFDPAAGIVRSFLRSPQKNGGLPDNVIYTLCPGDNNDFWIGTNSAGLVHFDLSTETFSRTGIPSKPQRFAGVENVSVLLKDRAGMIWIGTDGNGVFMMDPRPPKFKQLAQVAGVFVRALLEDRDHLLWIGTHEQGLMCVDLRTGRRSQYRDQQSSDRLKGNTIFALCEDRNGRLWLGTAEGLKEFDRATRTFILRDRIRGSSKKFIPCLYSIIETRDASLWMGSGYGAYQFDPSTNDFVRFVNETTAPGCFVDTRINCLYEDNGGILWMGTRGGGITRYDPAAGTWTHLAARSGSSASLSDNYITGIFGDSGRFIWITTASGLNRCDAASGACLRYDEHEGLPSGYCYACLADGRGGYWISTNRGLARLDTNAPSRKQIRAYVLEDGLQSYEFNSKAACRGTDGHLYFGGVNGINVFHPDSVADNRHVPEIVITGFKTVDWTDWSAFENHPDGIALNYEDAVFSFQFAALDYAGSSRNQYAYRMEGFESEWVPCGTRREVRYTRLAPGDYVFRVKGCNSDGVWNETGTSVRITIIPPWWMTWQFRAVAVLFVLGMTGGVFRIVERRKQMRQIERLEHQHLLELERARISKDMHDEIGSSLTKIAILSELSVQKKTRTADARKSLEKISRMSREVVESIGQIVWAIDPKHDGLDDVAAYLREYITESFEMTNTKVFFDFPDAMPLKSSSAQFRRNIFLTVKESVHNIIKHTSATDVRVRLRVTGTALEFSIRDNGAGFALATARAGGHGLANMRQRIVDIGGTFNIESIPGQGTQISIHVPITTIV